MVNLRGVINRADRDGSPATLSTLLGIRTFGHDFPFSGTLAVGADDFNPRLLRVIIDEDHFDKQESREPWDGHEGAEPTGGLGALFEIFFPRLRPDRQRASVQHKSMKELSDALGRQPL
jgi:hypothetical protein